MGDGPGERPLGGPDTPCGARASSAGPAPRVGGVQAAQGVGGASPVSPTVRQIFPQIKRTNKLYYKNKQNLFFLLTNKN